MRSAIIENGLVVNVIMGEITGSVPCDETVGIGWSWDGATFAAPPPPELEPVSPEEARAQRNNLLAQSDWTQVADAPVDQAAWATYRQLLRDITEQSGFPEVINWPTTPN